MMRTNADQAAISNHPVPNIDGEDKKAPKIAHGVKR
jgi:hypothetical protein